ncbi:DUF4251 domain-containing protein [Candidatus Sulfidibacterium hydrothermale]|uniref:DUF4251 domain-containing protein n=1 Tax=Candidatus Sulfidibacterium hydrothermale TaxID=2875962 RepID=UPI001F0B299D|nr:DUF4251 domain-containing protein [Candidatus Sulfidibacterium hydrothermale]UBM61187.1 DUF4251 domain-containing protein [Candidatus Sulfidibacterium hydrothermale]
MKKFVFILSFLLALAFVVPAGATAQTKALTKKEQRKLEKKKKKEERKKKSLAQRKYYEKLLKDQRWVFQATRLYGPSGQLYNVSPDVNFVAVKDSMIILQFGFQNVIGWNGVGGVTAEGFLSQYKLNPGKNHKQAMTVSAHIRPKFGGGSPYFTMTIMDDGSADIAVTLNNGDLLRMGGQLYAPQNASVYKGVTFP